MIGDRSVLGLIIARGGSKGVPRKNLAEVGGKPLIAWSIEAAQASRYMDRVVLSSEDAEIIETARAYGCEVPFVRPTHLADDYATAAAVLIDALDRLPSFDFVVLLQTTSPLRTGADIDAALELCIEHAAPSCVAVSPLSKPLEWLLRLDDDNRLTSAMSQALPDRRQDSTTVYAPNGAVFVADCNWIRKADSFYGEETIAYVMPAERSVDIDSPYDLAVARALISDMPTGPRL